MLYLVWGIGHNASDVMYRPSVVQFDNTVVVMVMDHVVYEIYMVGYHIVGHEHGSLIIHMDLHWKNTLHKTPSESSTATDRHCLCRRPILQCTRPP